MKTTPETRLLPIARCADCYECVDQKNPRGAMCWLTNRKLRAGKHLNFGFPKDCPLTKGKK